MINRRALLAYTLCLTPHAFTFPNEKSPPGNRTASNDCLPYEKSWNYFFSVSALALIESTVTFLVESTADLVESAAVFTESTCADAVESAAFAVVSAELLHEATNAPMAKINRSFFILSVFVCKIIISSLYPKMEKVTRSFKKSFLGECLGYN